jgi:hypothetical protein
MLSSTAWPVPVDRRRLLGRCCVVLDRGNLFVDAYGLDQRSVDREVLV